MAELGELLMPFAPRLLGIADPLAGDTNIRNMENFVLGLSTKARVVDFFPARTEGRSQVRNLL